MKRLILDDDDDEPKVKTKIKTKIKKAKGKAVVAKKDGRDVKNGRFVKGMSGNPAGRPNGSEARSTRIFRDALIEGAIRAGNKLAAEGGSQAEGMIAYCEVAALQCMKQYLPVLSKVMPEQRNIRTEEMRLKVYRTPEQVAARMKEMGLPLDFVVKLMALDDYDEKKTIDGQVTDAD